MAISDQQLADAIREKFDVGKGDWTALGLQVLDFCDHHPAWDLTPGCLATYSNGGDPEIVTYIGLHPRLTGDSIIVRDPGQTSWGVQLVRTATLSAPPRGVA
ncbi:MAG: hypothetical protein ACPHCN_18415 [Mycobacterium sp.]